MKQEIRRCLLPLLLLLLSGCAATGGREDEAFLALRTALLERETLELRADVTADYGERCYEYRLSYVGSGKGGVLTVEQPLELAGVELRLEDGVVSMRCEGAWLETGALVGELNPLQAFPLQIRAWQQGSVVSCWRESLQGIDCLAAEIDMTPAGAEERILCRVWFREGSSEPVWSELSCGGRAVFLCRFIR